MLCKASKVYEKSDALVLPIEEGKGITVDMPAEWKEAVALAAEGFTGKKSEIKTITLPIDGKLCSLVLVGIGKENEIPKYRFMAFAAAAQECKKIKAKSVTVLMDNAPDLCKCKAVKAKAVEAFHLANYSFNQFKSKPVYSSLEEVLFVSSDAAMEAAVQEGNHCAAGIIKARDLVNTPAMAMPPAALVEEAVKAGEDCGFTVRTLEKQEIIDKKMGAFWAVAKGAAVEPKLIIMEYKGAPESEKSVALVGKGMMYDSGGFNLKSSMTYAYGDMAGAAAVVGAMMAVASEKLKVNVYGVIPSCENILSRDAYLPGDVVTAYNGKTIEIDNTDAEGRMVLADALTYAFRDLDVDMAFDIATLTGAVATALGRRTAAYMSNDDTVRELLKKASHISCEKMWELPLDEELMPSISSHIADIKNNSGSANMGGGTIIGGLFLQEFVEGKPWAHLDIAALSSEMGGQPHAARGGTGFGASLLYHIVKQLEK